MIENARIPRALSERRRWILWKEAVMGTGAKKIPIAPWKTGNLTSIDATDPDNWTSLQIAQEYAKRYGNAIKGLCFALGDGITGIDLDDCINENGELNELATRILQSTDTYAELSPSHKGVHVLGFANPPHALAKKEIGLEIYPWDRYFTFTGEAMKGRTELTDMRGCVEWLYREYDSKGKVIDITEILEGVDEGGRNDACHQLATFYRRQGRSQDEALALVREWNVKNRPPLDDKELKMTVKSAYATEQPYKYYFNVNPETAGVDPPAKATAVERGSTEQESAGIQDAAYTDMGNAERFAQQHAGGVKWVKEWGWLVWDGKRWKRDGGEILELAKRTAKSIFKDIDETADDKEARKISRFALESMGRSRVEAMVELAHSDERIRAPIDEFDTNPMLFNVQNGIVDLTTGELLPHDPGAMITKIATTEYDPGAECPKWIDFLNRIFKKESGEDTQELIRYVQKIAGFSLTGIEPDRMFFMLYGSGANGKTTFITTIATIMGEYASETPISTFLAKRGNTVSNDLADLAGKRMVYASEIDENKGLDTGKVKLITGRGRVKARFLFKEYFEFTPTFKIWIDTNYKPEIKETTRAIWDRVKLIPFTETIPKEEQVDHYEKALLEESPGILKWLVDGCMLWQKEGLKEPSAVIEATTEYKEEMDQVKRFIEDCCELDESMAARGGDLYKAYVRWCGDNGEKSEDILSNTKFANKLAEKGFEKRRDKIGVLYEGISLKDSPQVDAGGGGGEWKPGKCEWCNEEKDVKLVDGTYTCKECIKDVVKDKPGIRPGNVKVKILKDVPAFACGLSMLKDGLRMGEKIKTDEETAGALVSAGYAMRWWE